MSVSSELLLCCRSLKDAFLHLLLKGFRHHERQLRNDLLLLLSLIAEKPGAPLIVSLHHHHPHNSSSAALSVRLCVSGERLPQASHALPHVS